MPQPKFDFYRNSFTFLRYLAAFSVFFGHITTHFDLNRIQILKFIPGVPIFFTISGYLIAHTLDKKQDRNAYFKNRILRIYPELILGVLVNLVVLLIFHFEYIKSSMFWLFNFCQVTFIQFWTPQILRNYGVGTPNGSLWTITIFVQFYIVIYFIYPKIKQIKFNYNLFLLIFFCILNTLLGCLEPYIPTIVYKLLGQTLIPYLSMFYVGICCYLYKDFLIGKKNWFYLIAFIYFFTVFFQLTNHIPYVYINCINSLMLGYLTINFGYIFPNIKIKKDITFGIYIYHMIIINIFVEMKFMNNYFGSVYVLIITGTLSIASYNLVNYILRKRDYLSENESSYSLKRRKN